jgi:peptidoglycan/xylan/chitin deacetylase (PgdA/CDA1 family)/GT2 family glycosyltransferase
MIELSVVIATFNRAGRLKSCLDALEAGAAGLDAASLETVVVVDGSTDATAQVLAGRAAPSLRVVWQENSGQARALNRGVAEAAGRYCLLLDDDILARPGMVAEHLRAQRESGGVLAAGRLGLRLPAGADWYARRFAEGWARHYARLDSGEIGPTADVCYGGNLSFPRDAFLAAGGFATDLPRGYDVELAHRLIARGLSPRYLREAEGVQDERKTWRELLADEEASGAGAVALYRREPATLPWAGLADFHRAGAASILGRRLLLALGAPAAALGVLGPVLDRVGRGPWFRFVRAYAFWRGVRKAASAEMWRAATGAVPILMYHAFSKSPEPPSRFVVAAREFEWQLGWLARSGYRTLGLAEYVRARREHRLPPPRTVVVTFDDGYSDNGAIAAPLLAAGGCGATVFLVTGSMGDANGWDAGSVLSGRPILSWDEARALERSGLRFAPHGRSHRAMEGLSDEELFDEIGGAWTAMRRELEDPVPVLAFPFGRNDAAARAAAEGIGLHAACTAKPGRNTLRTPLFALRRSEIGGDTGRWRFRLAVWFGDTHPVRNRRRLRS